MMKTSPITKLQPLQPADTATAESDSDLDIIEVKSPKFLFDLRSWEKAADTMMAQMKTLLLVELNYRLGKWIKK
jgi:hypothetical protein